MSSEDKTESIQTPLLASCCLLPGLNVVTCSLKELPLHCPSCAADTAVHHGGSTSSSQRRKSFKAPILPPADVFAQLTVEQIVLSRKPTLIDRLISRNKTALIMETKQKKRAGRPCKEVAELNGKTKPNSKEQHLQRKKLRSSREVMKKNEQKPVPPPAKKKKIESNPTPSTNKYATRISMKKVRIPFSLRSGRKMADILKAKRKRILKQHLQQNDSEKKVNQVDSNSNRCTDVAEDELRVKTEEPKPKRKRRKRCSMWVRKVKKRARKTEDLPVLNKEESEEDDQESEVEEEVEPLMPTLEKQVDHKELKLNNEVVKNENPDAFINEQNSILENLAEIKNELTAKVPMSNVEIDHTNAIEVKKEEIHSSVDSKHEFYCDDICTVETLGTKEYCNDINSSKENLSEENIEILKNSPENSNSLEECKLGKNEISAFDSEESSKSKCENIETDMSSVTENVTSIDKDTPEEDSGIVENENQLGTKGINNSKDDIAIETDSKENIVPDITNKIEEIQEFKCTDVSEELFSPTEFADNKSLEDSNNVSGQKNENLKMDEEKNGLKSSEIFSDVHSEDPELAKSTIEKNIEELQPGEADSTSDVTCNLGTSSGNGRLGTTEEEPKDPSISETSVLPDSTKDVKPSIPEDVLDKGALPSESEIILDKSNANKLLQIEMVSKTDELIEKDIVKNENVTNEPKDIEETDISVEQKQMKESVLQALGLKSLSAATEQKQQRQENKQKYIQHQQQQQQQRNNSGYTGTLKAVIKLNRTGDKKRTMVYKRSEDALATSDQLEYRICSDFPSTEGVPITHLADMGYNKKGFHNKNVESVTNSVYVNSDNNTSQPTEESDINGDESKGNKESNLIIPEKSSSFSIHPGRLCSDVCSYCFGKFGSLDTPCHVAQIKGEERQKKILQNEPHLTPESCLCDACYRYVDRKVNYHPKANQQGANNGQGKHPQPQPQATCCVVRCMQQATHTIKRKWILKLKKNLTYKLDIDMDKNTGIYFPFCTQHHYWVEYLTVCGICRKRLNRNNLFSLGREADRLNLMLAEDGIPARLSDNLFLCKLCRYYSNLRLKYSDTSAIPPQNKAFYKSYRRKILMSLDIAVSNSEDECEHSEDASTPEKKRLAGVAGTTVMPKKVNYSSSNGSELGSNVPDNAAGGSSSNNDSTSEEIVSLTELANLFEQPEPQQTRIQVKFGNVNIGTLSNLNIGQQSGGSAPVSGSSDKEGSDSGLSCHFDFKGSNTPEGSLERCVSTIQFDKKAKQLWTELQKPYGSQSMFLRHLIMMEKIWRAGHLVLHSSADEKSVKYVLNAKNKIRAFDNTIANSSDIASPINSVQVRPAKAKEVSQPNSQPPPIRIRQQLQQPIQKQPPQSQQQQQPRPVQQQPVSQLFKQHPPPQIKQERFPLLPNTGEIEVTPVKAVAQTQIPLHPAAPITVTVKQQPVQQQFLRPLSQLQQQQRTPNAQPTPSSSQQQYNVLQQQLMSKKLTPLDRAKALVRMALPQHRLPPPRYYVPPQNASVASQPYFQAVSAIPNRAPPPPLMKLQSFFQHQQQINQQSAAQQPYHLQQHFQHPPPRPILPKLPKSLTVVSRVNSKPTAITLQHSGITIEKQSAVPPMRSSHPLPIEKPIISVFREPAVSPQHH